MNEFAAWLILFLPLLAAAIITLGTLKQPVRSAGISIGAVVVSFFLSVLLYGTAGEGPEATEFGWTWLSAGNLEIGFGLRLDALSLPMLLIVTGVGGAIHIYSYGYMKGDPGFSRYFACLSLFIFSMIGIVLAANFIALFIVWELVGVSSYLLIGFWHEKPAAADAAKKAFLANRLGDFGFLLGIVLLWSLVGSLEFSAIERHLADNRLALGGWATVVGLLIFCGAVGKSAQFPLHVWLPDAMEGPTPVSALIHAATMVAAGVYMLCRVYFLYTVAPAWPVGWEWLGAITASDVIAWVGGITALLSAVIAIQQNDIKRILAYSTLSQLGYMVMAVGLGGPGPAMYHLTTHAFFKALLFLGAGSVILALHHEQDIWRMGGLRRRMPVTYWTFLLATLALAGVPPFSGFFSKEALLGLAYGKSGLLFLLAALVAILTTFYMFRLLFVAFLGPEKSEASGHAHESSVVITWPLVALAVPTVLAGFWGIGSAYQAAFGGGHAARAESWAAQLGEPFAHAPAAAAAGLLAVAIGFAAAWMLYGNAVQDPLPLRLGGLSRAMRNRFYFDEAYARLIACTQEAVARVADGFDRWLIAGFFVKGLHGTTEFVGRTLRLVQTGNLQTYVFLFVAGLGLLLWMVLGRQ